MVTPLLNAGRAWKDQWCLEHDTGVHREDCVYCLRDRLEKHERWIAKMRELHPAHAKNVDLKFRR